MNEQEPRPRFTFGEYEATPENSMIFLHHDPEHHKYDHVFIQLEGDEEDLGAYGFRPLDPEKSEKWEQYVLMMMESGWHDNVIWQDKVSNFDREVYERHHPPQIEIIPQDLTPRQERIVSYLGHLLESEILTANDFHGEGDLYI